MRLPPSGLSVSNAAMTTFRWSAGWLWFLPVAALAQIDPVKRDLVQLGYDAALQGHAPLAGYAFYYRNDPGFLRTNLTLRLAVAPVYLDSELGVSRVFGERMDLGIGLAGGGFADSYSEVREGKYVRRESFLGHSAEGSVSLYHLFNPERQIPLNFVLRGSVHHAFYERDNDTAADFVVPEDRTSFCVRTGVRWGGVNQPWPLRWRWSCPPGTKGNSPPNTKPTVLTVTAGWRRTRTGFGRRPCWPTRCRNCSTTST